MSALDSRREPSPDAVTHNTSRPHHTYKNEKEEK
jgi:hypothetical protein